MSNTPRVRVGRGAGGAGDIVRGAGVAYAAGCGAAARSAGRGQL